MSEPHLTPIKLPPATISKLRDMNPLLHCSRYVDYGIDYDRYYQIKRIRELRYSPHNITVLGEKVIFYTNFDAYKLKFWQEFISETGMFGLIVDIAFITDGSIYNGAYALFVHHSISVSDFRISWEAYKVRKKIIY